LYPTVSLDPSYSRTRYSGSRASTITGKQVARGVDVSNWTIPLDLSYEVDVWGRVRRSLESARATAAATADDVGVVRLTVESDVARYYYTLRSLDAQAQILAGTVTAYQEQVRLLSVQVRTGLASAIGVATAEFYPKFTITSSAGFESMDIATVFNWQSRVASILPSISIPIFQGGRLRANLAATKARYEQTVGTYVNQVLIAYGDVEDALSDLHAFSDEVGRLRDAVGASQSYLRLAQVQYRQGLADYLIV